MAPTAAHPGDRMQETPQSFGTRPERGNGQSPAGDHFERELAQLRRRVMRSASVAIDMLEASIAALWGVDHDTASEVRARDDIIDGEEVAIERECLRLLTLRRPYGQDFRLVTFCLKVNADIERVADHATSIAKVTLRLDPSEPPRWPTALVELADRTPVMCHSLLRAVLDEDVQTAQTLVEGDRVFDSLNKRLFDEIAATVESHPTRACDALLMYRLGRDLERVGDLMANIAEALVYLVTGDIIRHQRPDRVLDAAPESIPSMTRGLAGEDGGPITGPTERRLA